MSWNAVTIAEAERRLLTDSRATGRALDDARLAAGRARQDHPLGHVHVDAALARGIAEISSERGGRQLLAAERLATEMKKLEAAASAERKRLDDAHFAAQDAERLRQLRECRRREWAERTAAPVIQALDLVDARTLAARTALASMSDDIAFDSILSDLAEAFRGPANAVGLARREAQRRIASARAAEAVAAAVRDAPIPVLTLVTGTTDAAAEPIAA